MTRKNIVCLAALWTLIALPSALALIALAAFAPPVFDLTIGLFSGCFVGHWVACMGILTSHYMVAE